MKKIRKYSRVIAVNFIVYILLPVVMPMRAFALTEGPGSKEFSSFEPVATTDMVDLFTGDMTYNIPVLNVPGPDGAGYALSLSYHSGISSEDEASWCGAGWNINAGAINRTQRGKIDEFKGVDVITYNKTRPNWTVSATIDAAVELKSQDPPKDVAEVDQATGKTDTVQEAGASKGTFKFSLSKSTRFNNYRGFTQTTGFGVSFKGMAGLNMSSGGGSTTFSANINPMAILKGIKDKKEKDKKNEKLEVRMKEDKAKKVELKLKLKKTKEEKKARKNAFLGRLTSFGTQSFANTTADFSVSPYRGLSYNRSFSAQVGFSNIGIEAGFTGNFNIQVTEPQTTMKAYGYMYNPNEAEILSHEYSMLGTDNPLITSSGDINALLNLGANSRVQMDYMVEKGNSLNKRDRYIGIPYALPDNFSATGEGVSGGFNLWKKQIGNFYPNYVRSESSVGQMGLEVNVDLPGTGVGVGFDLKLVGHQLNVAKKWGRVDDFNENDQGFFRFTNDMGGHLSYTGVDTATAVNLDRISAIPGTKTYQLDPVTDLGLEELDGEDMKMSSMIQTTNYAQWSNDSKRLDKSLATAKHINSVSGSIPVETIMEYAVVNASGNKCVYGLPVFTKEVHELSVKADPGEVDQSGALVYRPLYVDGKALKNDEVIGTYTKAIYANSYLMTQSTTVDYVDVDDNGPSENDFGGWTKFGYRKWHKGGRDDSGSDDYYRYRVPYSGLTYQKGKIADQRDDQGTVSTGLKQMYHLGYIETKTHIAYFITNKTKPEELPYHDQFDAETTQNLRGSGVVRNDGLGALALSNDEDPMAVLDPKNKSAFASSMESNDQQIEMLEKIVLYPKNRLGGVVGVKGKPLQTVNMAYSQELAPNVPNNAAFNDPSREKTGKLTLKKLWFDNEGVVRSRVAPYRFYYSYPENIRTEGGQSYKYPKHISDKYPQIEDGFKDNTGEILSDAAQNPNYEPSQLDMWGNYQIDGAARADADKPWVYQGDYTKINEQFDPAAWHLKRIKLPSGGMIDIQYEQKDYTYIQDKRALAMVSLEDDGTVDSYDDEETKYYLNLTDLGIKSHQVQDYADLLQDYFITYDETKQKAIGPNHFVYFKYLYRLDESASDPTLSDCHSEYITGYTTVQAVVVEGSRIYLRLGDDDNWERKNKLARKNGKTVPKHICHDYLVTSANGLIERADCSPDMKNANNVDDYLSKIMASDDLSDEYEAFFDKGSERRKAFKKNVVKESLKGVTDGIFEFTPAKKNRCKSINHQLSYLRLPVHKLKKGGGVRVKRLLMYDKGLETGDAHLFGTEYSYKLDNGESSGVATNEPGAGREESALTTLLDRGNQSFLSRAISGQDKEQFEGPLGESILPGPSVGYSRVIVNNIHTGKTGTGHQVHEFYTCKDYPFEARNTEFYDNKDHKAKDWLELPLTYVNLSVRKSWYTQGYSFIINQMHGQMKQVSSYAGDYGGGVASNRLVSYTKKEFYDVGEPVNMVGFDNTSKSFVFEKYVPGSEELVSMEARKVYDETMDLNLELDINIMWASPISISPGFSGSFDMSFRQLATHVTSKVWTYPAMVKRTISYVDNVESVSENLYFDKNTGQAIGTVVYDGYNGIKLREEQTGQKHKGGLYSYSIPAAWIYEGMGQIAQSMNNTNQLGAGAMSFNTYGVDVWNNGVAPVSVDDPSFKDVIIGASATTYKNSWFGTDTKEIFEEYGVDGSNTTLITGLNKTYRPEASYAYYDEILNANDTGDGSNTFDKRIYNSGMIKSFKFFDWDNSNVKGDSIKSYDKWLLTNKVNSYSPHGNPLEEENALKIPTAVRFGYEKKILPTVMAKNAKYESIFFEDFENYSAGVAEAHSGFYGFDLLAEPNYEFVQKKDNLELNEQVKNRGGVVKLWLKSQLPTGELNANQGHNLTLVINGNIEKPFEKVASSGEWTQYQVKIDDWTGVPLNTAMKMQLKYTPIQGERVFVDDFRFQPYDAEVMCYVYDKYSLRLLAEFGDQHFGVFYQYNNEAQLVRKTIETEGGMRTLGESQYNVPRELRSKQ